jgi:hypothetical protein
MAATCSARISPCAVPDWLVTRPIRQPDARSRTNASMVPSTVLTRSRSSLEGRSPGGQVVAAQCFRIIRDPTARDVGVPVETSADSLDSSPNRSNPRCSASRSYSKPRKCGNLGEDSTSSHPAAYCPNRCEDHSPRQPRTKTAARTAAPSRGAASPAEASCATGAANRTCSGDSHGRVRDEARRPPTVLPAKVIPRGWPPPPSPPGPRPRHGTRPGLLDAVRIPRTADSKLGGPPQSVAIGLLSSSRWSLSCVSPVRPCRPYTHGGPQPPQAMEASQESAS